jgi:hypothetical protein
MHSHETIGFTYCFLGIYTPYVTPNEDRQIHLTRTVAVDLPVVIIQLLGVIRGYSRPMYLNLVAM